MNKKIKKIFAVTLIGVMSLALVACTKKAKCTPEESVTAYMNVLLKGSKEGSDKVGLSDSRATTLVKLRDDGFKLGIKGEPTVSKYLDDETVDKLAASIDKGLKNVEYKAISSKVDGDKASVQLEIRTIDVNAAAENMSVKLQEVLMADVGKYQKMSEKDIMKIGMGIYAEELEKASLVNTARTITVDMEKDKAGYWQISDGQVDKIVNTILNE